MTSRRRPDARSGWTDQAIAGKVEELRRLCLETDRPAFFPETLTEFCEWNDDSKRLRAFTRPSLYKPQNEALRADAQRLMRIGMQRWTSGTTGHAARLRELELLTSMLASRYHQERQQRLDAQREARALRASVDSLSAKLRELTGSRPVRLVKSGTRSGDAEC